ncbi:MAG: glycogen/starch/alpha-glucan phosphorylase [Clostridiales bacterium]|nr:glycogen/starch/alpha-glucan phosphorylase [Clostridiales bacterium]
MDMNNYKQLIIEKLNAGFATSPETATKEQVYKATCLVLRDLLISRKQINNAEIQRQGLKRVYYLCMEFLVGRSLKNNLFNLGLTECFDEALASLGFDLNELCELEADPGLGNGGLGRLASCFMDSLATLGYPAMGFSIRYDYGLFRQKIVENMQVELPDLWLPSGEVWMLPRSDKNFKVPLGGYVETYMDGGKMCFNHKDAEVIEATPYDVMISGAGGKGVSVLRLWKASAYRSFDMQKFSRGDYFTAIRADSEAELISKVLYPSDDHYEGKLLRLSQQYFLVSASLQSILKDHIKWYGSLKNLSDKVAIHINDTHPALAIPELMRLLMDEHGFGWDEAYDITVNTIAYTNHTVLAEALEKWDIELFQSRLPRIYMIIAEIDRRFSSHMRESGNGGILHSSAILWDRQVRMANLSVIGSHSTNGVSQLHSDIIKNNVFKDLYAVFPDRFTNVTNGIAHRRWLCQANPKLAQLVGELIGDKYKFDASELLKLEQFVSDDSVLKRLGEIKQANKENFASFVKRETGEIIDPYSRFDVQIKRLHEYKRQLLNVLKIISYYLEIKDNPGKNFSPQTFIFGAKAAGGYAHAKRVITLINCLAKETALDKDLYGKLRVLFVENYNVTLAERLIPASEVSEQISLAGKEASGTSNMKLMLNGALTLGTVDGANVEILERVGRDNMFAFGLTASEAQRAWSEVDASAVYSGSEEIRRVVDRLKKGFAGESFVDIATYLTIGGGMADPYMCLKDYDDYKRAAALMDAKYADKTAWNKSSLINIARAGVFAADRSIEEYASNIWHLKRLSND